MDYKPKLTTPGHDQDEQLRLQRYGIIVEHEPYDLWISIMFIFTMYLFYKFYRFQHIFDKFHDYTHEPKLEI